jgi:NhaP-type Na+/H+ and K+/H+ antiporter
MNGSKNTIFEIDKKYTAKLIIALKLAEKAVSELLIRNKKNKKTIEQNSIYKVDDLYIVFEKTDETLHFWFYSDKTTNWMEGKKGINFSVFFDENNDEGRIQYYRDSFIE